MLGRLQKDKHHCLNHFNVSEFLNKYRNSDTFIYMDIRQKEELYKSIMMTVAKTIKRRINEAGNYYNQHNLKENLDIESIPKESALNIEDVKQYDGVPPYSVYKYFGDCKNTVDVDRMWNATEMS